MKKITLLVLMITLTALWTALSAGNYISSEVQKNTIRQIKTKSSIPAELVDRGVAQTAAFWTEQDGTAEEFSQFCQEYFCVSPEEKSQLFERLCRNFEVLYGHNNRMNIEFQRPEQVKGYAATKVDPFFSAYNGLAHFDEDMFDSKLAFVVILNFPHYTLAEKQKLGRGWTAEEWGYARLGDVFTSRVPASVQQNISNVAAAANSFIDNYNIDMQQVVDARGVHYWKEPLLLISHWGLRDELKAAYADKKEGLSKQTTIYEVMKRIIHNEVPSDIVNHEPDCSWNPFNNVVVKNYAALSECQKSSNTSRYQHLLDFFHAEKAADAYCGEGANFINRRFDDDYEISVEATEQLFTELLSSPLVGQVTNLISKRLGRKLQPFDIWYDGFKGRSNVDQQYLDTLIGKKYPTKEAFAADLPNILAKLGFSKEKAQFICNHVSVDASVGAGHAWESMMRSDNSMLRTRVGENGMDYKGYNIGVHEFGHNVEQTISLHDVPNYFLRGVPNTGFTEALAFVFQGKDLELLGLESKNDQESADLNTLALFWDCYEIMGVSMVDIRVWKWLYEHPQASADELQTAVVDIAQQVWNQYYAPVFKVKDEPILAIYSHMIVDPLYLSAYPIGHLIDYQLETYLKDKNMGTEVCRIYKMGRLTPELWMERAVGQELSCASILADMEKAVKNLNAKKKK